MSGSVGGVFQISPGQAVRVSNHLIVRAIGGAPNFTAAFTVHIFYPSCSPAPVGRMIVVDTRRVHINALGSTMICDYLLLGRVEQR